MSRDNPWSRRVRRLGVAATAFGVALAVGDVDVRAQQVPPAVTAHATFRALSLVRGQVFNVRISCVGTFDNTPCVVSVKMIDAQGKTVREFSNRTIGANRTREFSVSHRQVKTHTRTFLRAEALVRWFPKLPLPDPCCCAQPPNPATTSSADTSDAETGEATGDSSDPRVVYPDNP